MTVCCADNGFKIVKLFILKGGMGLLQLFAEGTGAIPCCFLLTGKEMSEINLCDLYPSFC
jgi:hypothetical protein